MNEKPPITPTAPQKAPLPQLLRVLILGDSPPDVGLITDKLAHQAFKLQCEVIGSRGDFEQRLAAQEIDIVLSDFDLRGWDVLEALEILKKAGKDIPLIVVTDPLGDEQAVKCLKCGAADYVLKNRLERLPSAIWKALDEKKLRSELRQADKALRRNEACLAAGEKLTHTGSWYVEVSTQEVYWSQEAYRIFGFDPGAPPVSLRDAFLSRVHPDDRPQVEAWLQNPPSTTVKDYRIVLPDGSVRHLHDIAFCVTNEEGKATAIHGVACDVTEHILADQALRESEERFRRITETITEVFWTADPQITRMLYVSPSYEQVWERSVESLYRNPRSFLETVHAEDLPRLTADMELIRQGKPFDHEHRIRRPDGSTRWIWNRGFPVRDEAGQLAYYVGVAQDITARKEAEAENARLVTAIEQSAEAVVITNPQGAIEYVNPAFTRITGYSREEALGQNPRVLKSERQDPAFYLELWKTITQGETWRGELVNRRKDGTLYTEQMSITPVRSARGEVTHFIATKRDVTERKSLEEQVRQATKMEAVGRLAGGVAHDFNNLLTIINGYAELLIDTFNADENVSIPLKEIKSAGERAASLTRQLLAFSRRQVLAPQVLNLNAVVSNLEKMLKRLIGEDIKLRTVLDPELGRVKADPGQIEQVIMNLAVNARDAMPHGGNLSIETGNVDLDENYARTHVTVKPGPHVMLAVGDTGLGMTPEVRARIFEPFFTTKEQGQGTGLGLATVYGIVKQSGGSIWVYSEPGQGTVFKIYLPVVGESVSSVQARAEVEDTTMGSETILVVEDEEGVRSMINLALASAGYKVIETLDPERALATCAAYKGSIDLLLTDVVMPRLSGHVVAEKVTSMRPGIKVLYMSGYTDDAVVHHGVLSQDSPFIQKPFSPYALRKKIREVLGGK